MFTATNSWRRVRVILYDLAAPVTLLYPVTPLTTRCGYLRRQEVATALYARTCALHVPVGLSTVLVFWESGFHFGGLMMAIQPIEWQQEDYCRTPFDPQARPDTSPTLHT